MKRNVITKINLPLFVDGQINQGEAISDFLLKAESLVMDSAACKLTEVEDSSIHEFLGVLKDLIREAVVLNQKSLKGLLILKSSLREQSGE